MLSLRYDLNAAHIVTAHSLRQRSVLLQNAASGDPLRVVNVRSLHSRPEPFTSHTVRAGGRRVLVTPSQISLPL